MTVSRALSGPHARARRCQLAGLTPTTFRAALTSVNDRPHFRHKDRERKPGRPVPSQFVSVQQAARRVELRGRVHPCANERRPWSSASTELIGALGRLSKVRHGLLDFGGRQRARCGNGLHSVHREHLFAGRDGRGSDRLAMMRRVLWMRPPAHVHELDKPAATGIVNRICDLAPTCNMGSGVDARRGQVALMTPPASSRIWRASCRSGWPTKCA
jgi:hypothetical protein